MKNWLRTLLRTFKRGFLMVLLCLSTLSGVLVTAQSVYAADPSASAEIGSWAAAAGCISSGITGFPGVATGCVPEATAHTTATVDDKMFKPTLGAAFAISLINVAQFVTNRIAYETAVWVASGATGQEPLYKDTIATEGFWKKFGKDVAGEAIGQLSQNVLNDNLGIEFDLCRPKANLPTLALQLGIRQAYQPERPTCEFDQVFDNWSTFVSNIEAGANTAFGQSSAARKARNQFLLKKASEVLTPGQNALEASLRVTVRTHEKVEEHRTANFFDGVANKYNDLTDIITGNVTTPSDIIQEALEKRTSNPSMQNQQLSAADVLGADSTIWPALGMTALSTFTNTLLSETLSGIYRGLFAPKKSGNPLDVELVGVSGYDAAQEQFKGLLATTPLQLTEYNALSEFVVCPAQGIINRGLNNCVFDANFLSAVSRGDSAVPLTVQEAIDAGLLDGNKPLISPNDVASNGDPQCYTYGYCYGNLVKLRKARILPIGWELAAMANSISQPKTLQEAIDEFDNCSQSGTIDSDHKFCHLVDPNWILKYPASQCRAIVNGEIRLNSLSNGRNSLCVDSPSCLGQDSNGNCSKGYGYCIEEKNVWRFRGDECPEQFAGCLALQNTTDKSATNVILNTVDFDVCDLNNAGCRWYRTNKYLDLHATAQDRADDTYEWLPNDVVRGGMEPYETADRANDLRYDPPGAVSNQPRVAREYTSAIDNKNTPDEDDDEPVVFAYDAYSYEDRVYFNRNVASCPEQEAGCTAVNPAKELAFNYVRNGSFEEDQNTDGKPDHWEFGNNIEVVNSGGAVGSTFLNFPQNHNAVSQRVPVQGSQFYTASFYVRGGQIDNRRFATLRVYDENLNQLSFDGLSYGGDCAQAGDEYTISAPNGDEWKRLRCTLTTPASARSMVLSFNDASVFGKLDAVQLEVGEVATSFTEDYSTTPQTMYMKVAPAYLGCKGLATDHPDCQKYAGQCTAQDVGCNLYNPADGDPSVPAIVSAIDQCPTECVGYAGFKQEDTLYDVAPANEQTYAYFIPDKAQVCAEASVGCDAFTNIEAVAQGGEQREFYTYLRRCVAPDKTDANQVNRTSATFFTWEGSDNAGYQLKSWQLLESDTLLANLDVADGTDDEVPGLAPCTSSTVVEVGNQFEVVCHDDQNGHLSDNVGSTNDVAHDTTCNEHADIFTNPDCREFFDTLGNVHYRRFADTVTVTAQCKAYRKDVSAQNTCTATGGAWQAQQGACHYFGFSEESNACPAKDVGCRSYTGNTSANVSTMMSETFEEGNYNHFAVPNTTTAAISNESLAADGHSLRLIPRNGNQVSVATVESQLVDLVPNRSLFLSFWAKGDYRNVNVFLSSEGRVVDFVNDPAQAGSPDTFAVSGAWKLFTYGPILVPEFDPTGETPSIMFQANNGTVLYLDNLTLKMTSSTLNIVKDSWVIPAACDTNPNGVAAPQYYVGCEAYSDRKGANISLYQFSNLCSEKTVGCEAFYDTQNSDSSYGQVNNARCVSYDGDPSTEKPVAAVTDCRIAQKTYCTIPLGQSFCTFNSSELLPDRLPSDNTFAIVFGPETVVVNADMPTYLIDNGTQSCTPAFAGCQEVGVPTFTQDQKRVTGFESKYLINDPDQYDTQLCNNQELFCDEFKHATEGNFYFKSPVNKTCEYKTSVQLTDQNDQKQQVSGWFRTGTSEPCDWTDVAPLNGTFEYGRDTSFVIGGEKAGLWYNGDPRYDGWVATCESSYDMCTEFVDIVNTSNGTAGKGKSYYFINNDKLKDSTVSSGTKCDGRVSQKEGCVVFNNKTDSDLTYNASVSYVVTTHADLLLNQEPNTFVDPVSCEVDGGGEFILSPAAVQAVNTDAPQSPPIGANNTVNLCSRRCLYSAPGGEDVMSGMAANPPRCEGDNCPQIAVQIVPERSCLVDSDCPALLTDQGNQVTGFCSGGLPDSSKLKNDSNRIIKVARDRECSAWLSCESSRSSWNPSTNQYVKICDAIGLCREGKNTGDEPVCTQPDQRDPEILTAYKYSSRDVNWNGYELSGYAIPNQLPVELYDQFNTTPYGICADKNNFAIKKAVGKLGAFSCDTDSDCGCLPGANNCEANCFPSFLYGMTNPDYHLVQNAGPCDSTGKGSTGHAGACQVGHCEESGLSCSVNDDCDQGENCVIGYCQATASTGGNDRAGACNTNADCATAASDGDVATRVCDTFNHVCVDTLLSAKQTPCTTSDSCNRNGGDRTCVPAATTANGACYNNRCLTDIADENGDGAVDSLKQADGSLGGETQICRGYPELDSPFPTKVVDSWSNYNDDGTHTEDTRDGVPHNQASTPTSFVNGYEGSTVCAPIELANGTVIASDACVNTCSYDKFSYGGSVRYYPLHTSKPTRKEGDKALYGICLGGERDGAECMTKADCSDDPQSQTICQPLSSRQSMIGWQGYCLERDSSIVLYGDPQDTANRACLTWLPVDQLAGATDLFGKFTEAGFTTQDVNYCGDVQQVYDLKTTLTACAETNDGDCEEESTESGFDDDGPLFMCPAGFFAIAARCGGNICEQGSFSDDDYPYICVPYGSKKTKGTVDGQLVETYKDDDQATFGDRLGEVGELCAPPTVNERDFVYNGDNNVDENSDDLPYHFGGAYTATSIGTFRAMRRYYDDCTVKGLTEDALVQGYLGGKSLRQSQDDINDASQSSIEAIIAGGGIGAEAYGPVGALAGAVAGGLFGGDDYVRKYRHNFESYPACIDLVQVSSVDPVGDHYNVAWTNRMWAASNYSLNSAVNTYPNELGYKVGTALTPFGRAEAPGDLMTSGMGDSNFSSDPYPHRIFMCGGDEGGRYAQLVMPTGPEYSECSVEGLDTTTSERLGFQIGGQARSLVKIEFGTPTSDPVRGLCKREDCSCVGEISNTAIAGDNGSEDDDCNYIEPDANDGVDAPVCRSENRICIGGVVDKDGDACDSNADCGPVTACQLRNNRNVCIGGPDDGEACNPNNNTCRQTEICVDSPVGPKSCVGGPNAAAGGTAGLDCTDDDSICTPNTCVGTYKDSNDQIVPGQCRRTPREAGLVVDENISKAKDRLQSIFARSYKVWTFEDQVERRGNALTNSSDALNSSGAFTQSAVINANHPWYWDVRKQYPFPPQVSGLINCVGEKCQEANRISFTGGARDDSFSVDNQNKGVVEGKLTKHVTTRFYLAADPNHMPVRRIVVDWGDGKDRSGNKWPTDSQTPRGAMQSEANFYMNSRGNDPVNKGPICGSQADDFGLSARACSQSYVSSAHDYVCTTRAVTELADSNRLCDTDDRGRLLNAPCTGGDVLGAEEACVFQPRVHVMDNWGWCTGYCPGGVDGTDKCFDGSDVGGQNECDVENCPGEGLGSCYEEDGVKNPWVNFNGYVIIHPQ